MNNYRRCFAAIPRRGLRFIPSSASDNRSSSDTNVFITAELKGYFPATRALNRQSRMATLDAMDAARILTEKRKQVLELARRYGAHEIRVFGSVARGDAGPSSDIDFLVDMEPGRSLLDLGGLVADLQELLGRSVDVVTERGLKSRIRARVLEEAIPL